MCKKRGVGEGGREGGREREWEGEGFVDKGVRKEGSEEARKGHSRGKKWRVEGDRSEKCRVYVRG